ncbi:hypothetical protein N320_01732, partial [Buceros rhinoceros silvestris]
MAPMIEHLSGYKHRRAYISKEFPDKMRRKTSEVKECKISFLRRIAAELEKTEGLKMYKVTGSKFKVSVSQDEFPGRKSIPKHYKPYGKSKGNSHWNQGFLSQYEESSADASFAPANSYSYQTDGGSSSCGLRSNDSAMTSALRDSLALQTGSPASGLCEWLRQLSRS